MKLKESIYLKVDVFAKNFEISEIEITKDSDTHRVVFHYMYENFLGHRAVMDNYESNKE